MNYVYFNNKIVPDKNAKIPLQTNALQYGTGVFEGIRGYYNKKDKELYIVKLKEHYERLLDSAKIVGWNFDKSADQMIKITCELIRKNKWKETIYIRPFIYASTLSLMPNWNTAKPRLAIYAISLKDFIPTNRGLKAMITTYTKIDDRMSSSRAKMCGNYANSASAKAEVDALGFDEAIYLNSRGRVSEATTENIFIVRAGKLITPPVSEDALDGITRSCIIEIAQNENIEVVERQIERSELYVADEVFMCGTACQVAWICKIDGRQIKNGEIGAITQKLKNIYNQAVNGRDKKYKHWLTGVYI
jgi:branched-chain amino acid aminotransferase